MSDTNWPNHLKALGEVLESNKHDQDFSLFMDEVREVDVAEFMCGRASMWISTGMQGPWSTWEGRIYTPQKLMDEHNFQCGIRHLGRLDVFSDGSCYFVVQDCVHRDADPKPANHYGWYPRFFVWKVCEHECTSTKLGNCYYEYTCKKCGYTYRIDSSD